MYVTSEVLGFFGISGIFTEELQKKEEFKAWIGNNKYRTLHSSSHVFELAPYSLVDLKNTFLNDASRFSCSVLETMAGIERKKVISNSTAWLLVELYYAAFYSAHTMLRLSGCPFVQLEKQYCSILETNFALFNPSPICIEKGIYSFSLNNASGNLEAVKYKDSHTDLWNILYQHFDKVRREIRDRTKYPLLDKDILLFNSIVEVIMDTFNYDGCSSQHNWLSVVRNKINYHHAYGIWFPFSKHFSNDKYIDLLKKWKTNPYDLALLDRTDEIDRFIVCCLMVISICVDFTSSFASKISSHSLLRINYNKIFELTKNVA